MNRLLLILIVIFTTLFWRCNSNNLEKTPEEYEYLNFCSIETDSIAILDSLNDFLEQKSEAFYYLKNDSFGLVQLHIDKILYSPKCERFIVFVIIQDTIANFLDPLGLNKDFKDYKFEGLCFVGQKDNNLIKDIEWFQQQNVGSCKSYNDASELLEILYYDELSSYRTSKGEAIYYNVNDIRFWECKVWKNYLQ
jgi:hypothetical protein